MKKIFLTKTAMAASAIGFSILSVSANANSCKFYAGAGLDYVKYGLNKEFTNSNHSPYVSDVKSKGVGLLVPIIGMTFHENFGIEAGYSFSKPIKGNLKTNEIAGVSGGAGVAATSNPIKIKTSNIYLDLVGFMPVSAGQFDLIGGIGIGKINAKKDKNRTINTGINNKLGWRAKLGAQYNVHTNVAVRALVTYQTANSKIKYTHNNVATEDKFIKNMTSVGLSAVYTF